MASRVQRRFSAIFFKMRFRTYLGVLMGFTLCSIVILNGYDSLMEGSHEAVTEEKLEEKDVLRLLSERLIRVEPAIQKAVMSNLLVVADFMVNATMTGPNSLRNSQHYGITISEEGTLFLKKGPVSTRLHPSDHMEPDLMELSDEEYTCLDAMNSTQERRDLNMFQLNLHKGQNLSAWQVFHNRISQFQLYADDDPMVDELLTALCDTPITKTMLRGGGTQVKLMFYLANGGRAMFKPQRFPREMADAWPNHLFIYDFERHHAEIAAFHLDRLLGFRRAPPIAGRFVSVTREIRNMTTQPELLSTFITSPEDNICFHGECSQYCDRLHPVCGEPDLIQGSVAAYLPSTREINRVTVKHPWLRSFRIKDGERVKSRWETNNAYCARVRQQTPYKSGRRLLDLMDMAVFDFFTGNKDRHHYETFLIYGNDSFPLHLDQGRSFGKPYEDDTLLLAPIYQCCLIRWSTLRTLLGFYKSGEGLSGAMRRVLATDKVAPVLLEPHLEALDRRLVIILKTVYNCVQKYKDKLRVVVDDGF